MERDVIMREVRQLAMALARALLHVQMKEYDEAVDEIDRSIARVGLVVPDKLIRYNRAEMQDHLTVRGVIDTEYGSTVAMLLKQRGLAMAEYGNMELSQASIHAALLILEIIRDSASDVIPYDLLERINTLSDLKNELED